MRAVFKSALFCIAMLLAQTGMAANEHALNVVVNMLLLQDGDAENGIEKSLLIRWQRPLEREDGNSLTMDELRNYQIRYRRVGSSSPYRLILLDRNSLSTALTLRGQIGDQFEFAARVIDNDGRASAYTASTVVTFSEQE